MCRPSHYLSLCAEGTGETPMLVISRKDCEAILFTSGGETVRLQAKVDDCLKLYRGKKLVLKLETPQDWDIIEILGFNVTFQLIKYRAWDDVAIGIVADRELGIFREEMSVN